MRLLTSWLDSSIILEIQPLCQDSGSGTIRLLRPYPETGPAFPSNFIQLFTETETVRLNKRGHRIYSMGEATIFWPFLICHIYSPLPGMVHLNNAKLLAVSQMPLADECFLAFAHPNLCDATFTFLHQVNVNSYFNSISTQTSPILAHISK